MLASVSELNFSSRSTSLFWLSIRHHVLTVLKYAAHILCTSSIVVQLDDHPDIDFWLWGYLTTVTQEVQYISRHPHTRVEYIGWKLLK